jgi:DNA-binding MarR family transcriptional regulator
MSDPEMEPPTAESPDLPATPLGALLERVVVAGIGLTAQTRLADGAGELTLPQWRVLTLLGMDPDGMTVSRIASALGVTVPATGRQLRRLAFRGLVMLGPDAADRRSTRATLTEVGWRLRASVFAERRRRIEASLAGREVDPVVLEALSSVTAALEAASGQPPAPRRRRER